ncbi:MAG: hypothetical protein HKN78_08130 [Sphingomonadaceae bacterium]|nr:hypothetical protein [Sphingomonadaceae bacterium]
MKYLTVAIALAIAAPAAAFDNHGTQGHQMHGEGHEPMMCCEGTAEEREACRERHQAMGHEVADCEGDHAEGHGHHRMHHGDDAHEDHEARSDDSTPDE